MGIITGQSGAYKNAREMSSIEDLLASLQKSFASKLFPIVDVNVTIMLLSNEKLEEFPMEGAKLPTHSNSDLISAGRSRLCDLGLILVHHKW
jgi:hypothetical protein